MAYIWKEWLEQVRGKGLWIGVGMLMLASIFLIAEARSYPTDLGFEALLLSLFDINVYFIPLFGMFLASFSIYQEKELKTEMILLTKRESYLSFFLKKSVAVQLSLITTFIGAYLILAVFMKGFLAFHVSSFLYFLLVMIVFLFIFIQLGLFLGSIAKTRMQLIGINIIIWFFVVFLIDLVFLYYFPSFIYKNIHTFIYIQLCFFLGSIAKTRMQLIGINIIIWFFVVFLIDLVFLYYLPAVTYQNIETFSWLYFLNPIHTMRFFLETKFELFSLTHLSQLMEKFIVMDIWKFLLINSLIWPILFTGSALIFRTTGAKHE